MSDEYEVEDTISEAAMVLLLLKLRYIQSNEGHVTEGFRFVIVIIIGISYRIITVVHNQTFTSGNQFGESYFLLTDQALSDNKKLRPQRSSQRKRTKGPKSVIQLKRSCQDHSSLHTTARRMSDKDIRAR